MQDLLKRFTKEQKRKFEEFCGLLLEHNARYNLTAICGKEEIYIKHFIDSVYPEEFFPENACVVEIGSGGGFPSVPLMIVRPDLKFTLIESTGKKCQFLMEIVDKLGLNCGQVLNMRAEECGQNISYREKYDVAVARAVAKLNTLSEYCLPLVKVGGKFIAYKSVNEDLTESDGAIRKLGGAIQNIYEYSLPLDMGARRAVIINKVAPTPPKYPRGRGLERKKPLC